MTPLEMLRVQVLEANLALVRAGLVIHVVAESFIDLSAELPWLRDGDLFSPKFSGQPRPQSDPLPLHSRDFH